MESLSLRRSKRIASKSVSDTMSPIVKRSFDRENPKKYKATGSTGENSISALTIRKTSARFEKSVLEPRNGKNSEILPTSIDSPNSKSSNFGTKNHERNIEMANNGTIPTSSKYFSKIMTRGRKRKLESPTADNIEVILINPTFKSTILIGAKVGEISEIEILPRISAENYSISPQQKTLRRSGRVALKNKTTVSSLQAIIHEKDNFSNGTRGDKKALEQQITYKKNEIVMARMTGHMIWPAKILDVDKTSVNVFFYGDHSTGKIFKSKLMKFDIFLANYTFELSAAKKKEILRHKGILEAIHEKTSEKTL